MPNVIFQKLCTFRLLGKLYLVSILLEVGKSKAHGSTTKQFCIESIFQAKLKPCVVSGRFEQPPLKEILLCLFAGQIFTSLSGILCIDLSHAAVNVQHDFNG